MNEQIFRGNEINHLEAWKREAYHLFQEKLKNKVDAFPCIPAVQGNYLGQLRFSFLDDVKSHFAGKDLADILKEYNTISKETGQYASLIIFSNNSEKLSVQAYEDLFWSLLSDVSFYDEESWPANIPMEPENQIWEYCFQKEPYFVYCATPSHKKRKSRYFPFFMLALTPRWVLEQFEKNNKKAKNTKASIRNRLTRYDRISPHPDLKTYGEEGNLEWKQYFLRDDETSLPQCPFKRLLNFRK